MYCGVRKAIQQRSSYSLKPWVDAWQAQHHAAAVSQNEGVARVHGCRAIAVGANSPSGSVQVPTVYSLSLVILRIYKVRVFLYAYVFW